MALDPRKQAIFELWLDYDHALDDVEKGQAKVKRNKAIRELLESTNTATSVDTFLSFFFNDYREWLVSEGHRKARHKRF